MNDDNKIRVIRGDVHNLVQQLIVSKYNGNGAKRKECVNELTKIDNLSDDEWEYINECILGAWDIEKKKGGRPRAPYRLQIEMEVKYCRAKNPDWSLDQCVEHVKKKFTKEEGLKSHFEYWLKNEVSKQENIVNEFSFENEAKEYILEIVRSNTVKTNPFG